jgi:hypothetical protein
MASRHRSGLQPDSDSDDSSSSSGDERRLRAPSAAFMAEYLRGPTRRRAAAARSPSPVQLRARGGAVASPPAAAPQPRAAPASPPSPPRRAYAAAPARYDERYEEAAAPPLQQRALPPIRVAPAQPQPPQKQRPPPPPAAPAPPAWQPAAAPPPPAAPRPARLPEAAPADDHDDRPQRRPTRPVSPPRGATAGGGAYGFLSGLAAAGRARANAAAASGLGHHNDTGDDEESRAREREHSPSGSFTPSEESDVSGNEGRRRGGGVLQHRRDVRAPPSILNDGTDVDDDGGGGGGARAASERAFSDVSLADEDDEEEEEERADVEAVVQPRYGGVGLPPVRASGWDVFRGAAAAAVPSAASARPRSASAAPATRRGRSPSPPSRRHQAGGAPRLPSPPASPASSLAPSLAPSQLPPPPAVWAPPEVPPAPSDAPLRSAVLIVDPEVEWRRLAAAAAACGHVPVALLAACTEAHAASLGVGAAASSDAPPPFAMVLRAAGAPGGPRDAFGMAAEARAAAAVARLRWVAVLPGGRAGVEAADVLAALLGLRHCPLSTLAARRDKAAFGDALDAAGVPRAPGALCRYPEEAWRFGRAAGYPLLVRDALDASAPGAPAAWLCRTDAQAGAAVGLALQLRHAATPKTTLRAAPAAAGTVAPVVPAAAAAAAAQPARRRHVLAERCISGDAFLVGVFAAPGDGTGRPLVTDLWHFQQHRAAAAVMAAAARALDAARGGAGASTATAPSAAAAPLGAREREKARTAVASGGSSLDGFGSGGSGAAPLRRAGGPASNPYDQAVLVDATLPEFAEIVSYASRAAAAAGLSHGPGHVKLRAEWAPGRGATRPLAIAFSPTFAPGGFAALAAAATGGGWDPFAAAIIAAAAAAGERDAGGAMPPAPRPRLHARVCYVPAPPLVGRVTAWEGEDDVAAMRSYVSHAITARPGARVAPAAEPGRNALAAVRLLHESWEVVDADAAAVLGGALRVRVAPAGRGGVAPQACTQQ